MAGMPVKLSLYRNGQQELSDIDGERFARDGRTYLRYERDDEGDTVKSLITISHSEIRIHQTGSVDADMHFRPEKRSDLVYTTGYGRMIFLIETSSIASEITPTLARIYLKYRILTEDGEEVGANEVRIEAVTVDT